MSPACRCVGVTYTFSVRILTYALVGGNSFVKKINFETKNSFKHMENKKGINFVFAIVAVIIGVALWKQFDFDTFKFQKPALAIVYLVVFIASVYLLIKDYNKRSEN